MIIANIALGYFTITNIIEHSYVPLETTIAAGMKTTFININLWVSIVVVGTDFFCTLNTTL